MNDYYLSFVVYSENKELTGAATGMLLKRLSEVADVERTEQSNHIYFKGRQRVYEEATRVVQEFLDTQKTLTVSVTVSDSNQDETWTEHYGYMRGWLILQEALGNLSRNTKIIQYVFNTGELDLQRYRGIDEMESLTRYMRKVFERYQVYVNDVLRDALR